MCFSVFSTPYLFERGKVGSDSLQSATRPRRKKKMESSINSFCKGLGAFCNHLESSCHALKQAVERRPIPLDSASTTFIQGLDRRISSTSTDLSLLESMSFDTVSFEELLGHCTQVFKKNETDLLVLRDCLRSSSSVQLLSSDSDEEEQEMDNFPPEPCGFSAISSKNLDDDLLLDDSTSLKNFGLSDACLATIASEANDSLGNEAAYHEDGDGSMFEETESTKGDGLVPVQDSESQIHVLKDEYENLPKHMKGLASWEDLVAAVETMSSALKTRSPESNIFHQDEIASLGLGSKARAFLLLLIKLKCAVVETVDGEIHYRLLCRGLN